MEHFLKVLVVNSDNVPLSSSKHKNSKLPAHLHKTYVHLIVFIFVPGSSLKIIKITNIIVDVRRRTSTSARKIRPTQRLNVFFFSEYISVIICRIIRRSAIVFLSRFVQYEVNYLKS